MGEQIKSHFQTPIQLRQQSAIKKVNKELKKDNYHFSIHDLDG